MPISYVFEVVIEEIRSHFGSMQIVISLTGSHVSRKLGSQDILCRPSIPSRGNIGSDIGIPLNDLLNDGMTSCPLWIMSLEHRWSQLCLSSMESLMRDDLFSVGP